MSKIIDDFPTLAQVEAAIDYEIVEWHFFLRPTMSNDELPIVKAIAQRYERMSPSIRESHAVLARRRHQQ